MPLADTEFTYDEIKRLDSTNFFNTFSSNVCLGGFAGSRAFTKHNFCAGPDPTTRSRNSRAMAEFYPNVERTR